MVTAAENQGAEATPGETTANLSSSPTPRKGRGSVTRLPKGAIAPDKTTKTITKGRGRRAAAPTTTPETKPKRAYTRRNVTTQTGSTTALAELLAVNGFTSAARLVVTEGRKTLILPQGLLRS